MPENAQAQPKRNAPRRRRWWVFVLAGLFILLGVLMMGNWLSGKPAGLGVSEGRLAKCPDSPNCVSSQEDRESHKIAPLTFTGDADAAFSRLVEFIRAWPRTRIVTQTENYLHVEFTTAVLRFVDDVEFLLVPEENVIHVRSASRVGHSDLGKNRQRVEQIRAAFASKAE